MSDNAQAQGEPGSLLSGSLAVPSLTWRGHKRLVLCGYCWKRFVLHVNIVISQWVTQWTAGYFYEYNRWIYIRGAPEAFACGVWWHKLIFYHIIIIKFNFFFLWHTVTVSKTSVLHLRQEVAQQVTADETQHELTECTEIFDRSLLEPEMVSRNKGCDFETE